MNPRNKERFSRTATRIACVAEGIALALIFFLQTALSIV
jgi:hypothetical protein